MKWHLLKNLCCPDCRGDIEVTHVTKSSSEEIVEGSLLCKSCHLSYRICEGIPVLLPSRFSNVNECAFRKKVSENVDLMHDDWRSLYDIHHFRKHNHLRIRDVLSKIKTVNRPKVFDIGIAWGVTYLPFILDIDLYGLDFSLESLILLKKIYEKEGVPIPNLVCASLSSIPFKDIKFDLIWSSQVYMVIPDIEEIKASFSYVITELLANSGIFIVDNLNYHYFRIEFWLKRYLKLDRSSILKQERFTGAFYSKYYLKKDFDLLMDKFNDITNYKIFFSESLFHPELKIISRSSIMAHIDALIGRTILAKFLGRQITLVVKRN